MAEKNRRSSGGSFGTKPKIGVSSDVTLPWAKKDANGVTQYNKGGQGLAGIAGEIGNFMTDFSRNELNQRSDLMGFLLSQKPTNRGDRAYGVKPSAATGVVPDESSRRASVLARAARSRPGGRPEEQMSEEDQFAKYLSRAESLVPGASDWGALESRFRSSASESDAKLAAMFSQLQGAISADAPVIGGIYDEGNEAVNQSAQQASQAIMQGYDAARNSQQSMLQALGIQDAAAGLQADGGGMDFAAQNQGQATQQVAETNQINSDALTKNKSAALNYNEGMGNAAGLQGAESRGQLQASLMDALSELAFAQSQEAAQRKSSVYEVAMGLQGQDQGSGLDQSRFEQEQAELIAANQQQAYENAAKQSSNRQSAFLRLVEMFEGDIAKASEAFMAGQQQGYFS